MSKLRKIIDQEIGDVLVKEGFRERMDTKWSSLNQEGCEGPNRNICIAQMRIAKFVDQLRALESDVEIDLKKMNLEQAPWLEKMFERRGKIQNVIDHLDEITKATPEVIASGDVPDVLDSSWQKMESSQNSAKEFGVELDSQRSQINGVLSEIQHIIKQMSTVEQVQDQLKERFEDLYSINETMADKNSQFDDDDDDDLPVQHKETLEAIEILEADYQALTDKITSKIEELQGRNS